MNFFFNLQQTISYKSLSLYFTASRKRRSSSEQTDNSLGGNHKKPRVFFSDDQKELLRVAYIRDPYPSQARIEELASQLSVGTKTIVNWFHNHRMRAKQANGLGSPTMVPHLPALSTTTTTSSQSGVRLDPSDDSNQSSTYSEPPPPSSAGSSAPPGAGGGSQYRQRNLSSSGGGKLGPSSSEGVLSEQQQWLFPHFEPLTLKKQQHHGDFGARTVGDSTPSDDDDDDNEGCVQDLSSNGTGSHRRLFVDDEMDNEDEDNELDDSTEEKAEDLSCKGSQRGPLLDSNSSIQVENNHSIPEYSGFTNNMGFNVSKNRQQKVNKRKKSKPQWVYEGLQLDRSISLDGGGDSKIEATGSSRNVGDEEQQLDLDDKPEMDSHSVGETINNDDCPTENNEEKSTLKDSEQPVCEENFGSDEEDANEGHSADLSAGNIRAVGIESISKLEKSIETDEGSDWEDFE